MDFATFRHFVYSQFFVKPAYPVTSFEGKTVIITGSNTGLALEAARHIARLSASTLILAVRDLTKGENAKRSIEESTHCSPDVIQVWQLDLASAESVKAFADRASTQLPRIDVLLESAGIATKNYNVAEGDEMTIKTNVTSTFQLALLLLPKLKETARKYNVRPNLVIVSSEVHGFTTFPEKSAPEGKLFETLNEKDTANMGDRYPVSKLLEVFTVREMVKKAPAETYPVTINFMNPGFCFSELGREMGFGMYLFQLLMARTTEMGSRTLVHAAHAGPESHGQYLSDCEVTPPSKLVLSSEGEAAQKKVYKELGEKLEKIQRGIMQNL